MVYIGIIGVGAAWESRYLPALVKLGHRICVRAVYDPVASRAEQVAAEFRAASVPGMLAMASRSDVQAILMLDPSWHGVTAVRLLSTLKKPIYFAGCLAADTGTLEELQGLARSESLTLFPELARRYTPASSRLQELMVTRLGRPRRIRIEAVAKSSDEACPNAYAGPPAELLIALFDWCSYVIRRPPTRVTMHASVPDVASEGHGHTIRIEFLPPKGGGEPSVAELHFHEANGAARASDAMYEVQCERGTATLSSHDRISWCADADTVDEALTSDRPDVEVMLDQFCRRVVGGLIPVADVGDLCRGARLLRFVEESRRTGSTVSLNGDFRGVR